MQRINYEYLNSLFEELNTQATTHYFSILKSERLKNSDCELKLVQNTNHTYSLQLQTNNTFSGSTQFEIGNRKLIINSFERFIRNWNNINTFFSEIELPTEKGNKIKINDSRISLKEITVGNLYYNNGVIYEFKRCDVSIQRLLFVMSSKYCKDAYHKTKDILSLLEITYEFEELFYFNKVKIWSLDEFDELSKTDILERILILKSHL